MFGELDYVKITYAQFAKMIDPSSLKLDTSYADFDALVGACKKYSFGCCFHLAGILCGNV